MKFNNSICAALGGANSLGKREYDVNFHANTSFS